MISDMLPDVALLEYLIAIWIKFDKNMMTHSQQRHGIRLCMCVKNGELSFLGRHVVEEVLAAKQQPFLALTDLAIWWREDELLEDGMPTVVPESLLDRTAPCLQHLQPWWGLWMITD